MDSFSLRLALLLPGLIFLIPFFSYSFLDDYAFLKGWLCFSSILIFLFVSFISLDPLLFLVAFEFCVFPMFFIFLSFSKDTDKFESVLFITLMNLMGSIPFMLFVSVWFSADNFLIGCLLDSFRDYIVFLRFFLLLVFKFPMFIAHAWLTKAHVRGSGFCSMILASVMLKLGTFGFLKFVRVFQKLSLKLLMWYRSFCLLGCIFFLFCMLRVYDAKLLVASSSVVHIASIIPAIAFYSFSGVVSRIFMMVGHGFVSFILFMLVSVIYENSHSRSIERNKRLESVGKIFMLIFFLFLFLNLGFPPFVRFLRELFFCLFYLGLSNYVFVVFCLRILASILYVIFFTYRFLFGKKECNFVVCLNLNMIRWCLFILSWFIFLPFIFFLISLTKNISLW